MKPAAALAEGTDTPTRPWGLALFWLIFLGSFFFATYLGSLEIVSWRDHVPTIIYPWERHIPFLAWTVVPYWSIDALYGLSLFLCRSRDQLDTLAKRLLTAQLIAIPIFIIAPLRLVATTPADRGIFEPLFAALDDIIGKPFNLAPSLHIALLVILWFAYARYIPHRWHWLLHLWATLIGISVLTVFQHHFFDVPTGAMLGFFCVWLWPEKDASPLGQLRVTLDPQRRRLGLIYAAGSAACLAGAVLIGGWAHWLLWPATSLLLVALAYGLLGPGLFQKNAAGRMSLASRLMLLPYLLGAWINSRLWTRKLPPAVAVMDGIWLGRIPSSPPADSDVIDLTAEFPAGAPSGWFAFPQLDLTTPEVPVLAAATESIEQRRSTGRQVLVCCALGFSRSAAAVATWLLATERAATLEEALAILRRARPQVRLKPPTVAAIAEAAAQCSRPAR